MIDPNSKWLAERLISRLSPSHRDDLERSIQEHLGELTLPEPDRDGFEHTAEDMPHAVRLYNMLGRLSAMTA